MADYTPVLTSYKTLVNQLVGSKVSLDSIDPTDVATIGISLADLLISILNKQNDFAITGGVIPPSDLNGVDLDLYVQGGAMLRFWRKRAGVWINETSVSLGVNIVDGAITINATIDDDLVTVSPGSWSIGNVIYSKATQTQMPITAPNATFGRIDAIIANTSGSIAIVDGTASSDPTAPTIPAASIAVAYIYVPSLASGTPAYIQGNNLPTDTGEWALYSAAEESEINDFMLGKGSDDKYHPVGVNAIVEFLGLGTAAFFDADYFALAGSGAGGWAQGGLTAKNRDFQNFIPLILAGRNIYYYGTSIVVGYGASSTEKRWTSIFSDYVDGVEINNGSSGSTLEKRSPVDAVGGTNMIDKLSTVPTYDPDTDGMLVLAFGINDVGYNGVNYTVENYILDYNTVLNSIISKGWPAKSILIISPDYADEIGYDYYSGVYPSNPPVTHDRHVSFIEATASISYLFGTMYLNIYDAFKGNNGDSLLISDGVHPNDSGYLLYARSVYKYIYGVTPDIATAIIAKNAESSTLWGGASAHFESEPSPGSNIYGVPAFNLPSGRFETLKTADLKTTLNVNNVDNTSDANKPVSTAQQTAIDGKVANDLTASTTVAPSKTAVNNGLALKESSSNKQNTLTADGTGVKFPTVDSVNTGLGAKQNLVTLTTTGSGAATFNQGTGALNIPTPSWGAIIVTDVTTTTKTVDLGHNEYMADNITQCYFTTNASADSGDEFTIYGGSAWRIYPGASSQIVTPTAGSIVNSTSYVSGGAGTGITLKCVSASGTKKWMIKSVVGSLTYTIV